MILKEIDRSIVLQALESCNLSYPVDVTSELINKSFFIRYSYKELQEYDIDIASFQELIVQGIMEKKIYLQAVAKSLNIEFEPLVTNKVTESTNTNKTDTDSTTRVTDTDSTESIDDKNNSTTNDTLVSNTKSDDLQATLESSVLKVVSSKDDEVNNTSTGTGSNTRIASNAGTLDSTETLDSEKTSVSTDVRTIEGFNSIDYLKQLTDVYMSKQASYIDEVLQAMSKYTLSELWY